MTRLHRLNEWCVVFNASPAGRVFRCAGWLSSGVVAGMWLGVWLPTPAAVLLVALLTVIVVCRAIRDAPVLCDDCHQLIPPDEWEAHVAGCGGPSAPATRPQAKKASQ